MLSFHFKIKTKSSFLKDYPALFIACIEVGKKRSLDAAWIVLHGMVPINDIMDTSSPIFEKNKEARRELYFRPTSSHTTAATPAF
ncbi:hypothetical protein Y032_0011g1287 [Ancylostoma ceylanicum]|uniref:Uncharacterized protein n=1 Tax=Ancylostoma ceylanicum TaxID=53326 RepID=A0A016VD86_9BILA|nr:hypothetical protein Y032_0011g1287 [Ancylostoma ceylanicum]